MALFWKWFYKKPPDGILDVSERIYVFDSCVRIKAWEQEEYKAYLVNIISQFQKPNPESSLMIFNFGEGDTASKIHGCLLQYSFTIMDYPRHYEGCPLLSMEVIHHFLKSSESWLSLGKHNALLMHSEVGGWPVLAFMSAALLLYRKHYTDANKALHTVHKRAPPGVSLQLMSRLNYIASQLRYLQYVLKRNDAEQWPPADKALTLVCVMMRMIPNFDGKGGCCPAFRIYGRDPSLHLDKTPKLLFSTVRVGNDVRSHNQGEIELVIIDINCYIQGDVVLECIHLHDDWVKEDIMYRAMFNTAFIKSNKLVFNRDEIDVSWDSKDQFPKAFKAELLFSEAYRKPPQPAPPAAKPKPPPPPHISGTKRAAGPPSPPPLPSKGQPANKLKPLHWMKLCTVEQGSLWAEAEKSDEAARALDIDMSELETLFSESKAQSKAANKPEKVQLIGYTRALYCEIVLSRLKASLPELMEQVLNLDDSAMEIDIVDNLLKICPTKEEMELLHGYRGEAEMLGKCEQIFLELMKVPRSEAKLVVLSYILQLSTKVSDYKDNIYHVFLAVEQIRSSVKLRRVMLTILSLGNALNKGTTRGAAVGFRLDSLSKLNELARSNEMPLMHCLCKILADKLPELLDFSKELGSLEAASKIQLRTLEEELTAITKGLEKAVQEKKLCKKDGHLSQRFQKYLKEFLASAVPDVKELCHLYIGVGRGADSLSFYFGEEPRRCPYERVIYTLLQFVRMFNQAHDENCKQIEAEKKEAQKAAEQDKLDADESKTTAVKSQPAKRLPPLHWEKLNTVGKDSLWAEAIKYGEAARVPEIDTSELETLFSALEPKYKESKKPKKVQLIYYWRAYNCEIMISKVKTPLPELMEYVLNLDESAMDVDQVDSLIKLCPTKEEMELLWGYKGDLEDLGKCEQFFLEIMKVPRAEAKLIVFSYMLQFNTKVSDLRNSLEDVYLSSEQIRSSVKLRRVMQTVLSLGNALNQGTTRGAAVGFRLDSLSKLNLTRATSNKMTLMHYLCKVLADQQPELLDFSSELGNLEPASKIQLIILAEKMIAITKGLEKGVQEKRLCIRDGLLSKKFRKSLKKFLYLAEPDVKALRQLYSCLGRVADSLSFYFGEDPAKCPYEKVIDTLLRFVRMFNQAHDENCKQIEAEKSAAQNTAEQEKSKAEKEAGQEKSKAAEL